MGICEKLRQAIKSELAKGVKSQGGICRVTSITPSILCNFLQGKRGLSAKNIDRLCDAMGFVFELRERS